MHLCMYLCWTHVHVYLCPFFRDGEWWGDTWQYSDSSHHSLCSGDNDMCWWQYGSPCVCQTCYVYSLQMSLQQSWNSHCPGITGLSCPTISCTVYISQYKHYTLVMPTTVIHTCTFLQCHVYAHCMYHMYTVYIVSGRESPYTHTNFYTGLFWKQLITCTHNA